MRLAIEIDGRAAATAVPEEGQRCQLNSGAKPGMNRQLARSGSSL
eukprot:CAMPEP_0194746700 /NCGR_PEP_ID=MMETSP0323_2-20130528/677_1 /TAXON_ID=2866 ORGANISM="Crypthecodinium cohnii, Strain Seligo" /NCGR_SAMPLE_ID=MMETSP0323_2 /ASSEMBLY_ACC=CAM_ASM_000346 /LENGTH=44 /DNA_ID= /DNA_START= /DNA_END= /DNA_ORIENTATION=